jgi:hypothetical protein
MTKHDSQTREACRWAQPARVVDDGYLCRVSDDTTIGGARFTQPVPVGPDVEASCVAHLFGDEAEFRQRLEELMNSSASQAAVLSRPIPVGLSGPETEDVWQALDAVGGAVVRSIVPLSTTDNQ